MKTKFVTSSAQTVVPGFVVIVGLLNSSTLMLITFDGRPLTAHDTVLTVAKVRRRIPVSSVMLNGVADMSKALLVAPVRFVQTLPVVAFRSCH